MAIRGDVSTQLYLWRGGGANDSTAAETSAGMMPGSNPQWEMLEPAALAAAVQQLEPVGCATEDHSSCATSTHDGSTSAATPELAEECTSGLRQQAPTGHRERRSEELEPVAWATSVAPVGNTIYGPPLS